MNNFFDDVNFNGNKPTGVPDPVDPLDAANKQWVEEQIGEIPPPAIPSASEIPTDETGESVQDKIDDADSHIADTNNPHNTTLEQARNTNNQLAGDIDFNNFTGINIPAPNNSQDIANKQFVEDAISQFKLSVEWQDSVLSIETDEPGTHTDGDRYLIGVGATGNWSGYDDYIAQWSDNAADWIYTPPKLGMFVGVDTQPDGVYYYGGSSWTLKYFEATTASNLGGTGSYGVFKQKTGHDLEFRAIQTDDNKIVISILEAENEIRIGLDEAGIPGYTNLTDGSNADTLHSHSASNISTDETGVSVQDRLDSGVATDDSISGVGTVGDPLGVVFGDDSTGELQEVVADGSPESAGSLDKAARIDHTHKLSYVDCGEIIAPPSALVLSLV